MKRKIIAAVVAVAVVLPAAPAQAASSLTSVSMSTTQIVLDGDAGCGNRSAVTVKVDQPDPDAFVSVDGTAVEATGDDTAFLAFINQRRSGNVVTYTDSLSLCGLDDPGRYTLRIEVTFYDENRVDTSSTTFYVRRPSSLSFNAAPEPARRNSQLTHSGQLKLDPFGWGSMYGASGQKLTLAFKKYGTSTWANKATVTTGKDGKYSYKYTTTGDGTWRITYPGSSYRQSVAVADYVDTN